MKAILILFFSCLTLERQPTSGNSPERVVLRGDTALTSTKTMTRLASPPTEAASFAVGRSWLAAFKTLDAKLMAPWMQFPFAFRTTNQKKRCEGVVGNIEKWSSIVRCLKKFDSLLVVELRESELSEPKSVAFDQLSPLQRKSLGGGRSDERIVRVSINGDGIMFEFFLVTVSSHGGATAIKTLLLDTEFPG